MGDDHNANLALVFRRLGPDINAAIAQGHTVRNYSRLATTYLGIYLAITSSPYYAITQVRLHGRDVPVRISTCLDYSATRSMYGMRSNASPHSLELDPHMIILAPEGASWPTINELIQKELPWRELPRANKPLNHLADKFPFKCSRCQFRCRSQVRIHTAMYPAMYPAMHPAITYYLRWKRTRASRSCWRCRPTRRSRGRGWWQRA